ncbi:sulfite exporter TauE/SafE family protein [Piscinibacter sakaiensis]|uniref:urease accessory protein UreH domain-containing protein n=1 Tax=Piscinibacter sakaiensis TaxID=1547922 RepID=UPI003AADB24F
MIDTAINLGLSSSALLMGLVGGPHCLAMCGAACSAVAGRCGGRRPRRALLAWQLGRAVAYSAAGAAVASSVGLLAQWGSELAWLRPWWLMLHVAALALGLWMSWQGRAPAWLAAPLTAPAADVTPQRADGRSLASAVISLPAGAALRGRGGSASLASALPEAASPAWRAGLVGLGWVALPCGLLHAALLTAALGSSALDGAMVMASFAVGSGLSLWVGPSLWLVLTRWLPSRGAERVAGANAERFGPKQATRLAGGLLTIGAMWALWHGALHPLVDAFCATT